MVEGWGWMRSERLSEQMRNLEINREENGQDELEEGGKRFLKSDLFRLGKAGKDAPG